MHLHAGVYRLRADLRVRGQRRAGLSVRLLAAARHFVGHERVIDDWWVSHTKAWTIPGTEDLKPYITGKDKARKWLFGTAGMAVISAILAGVMALLVR